MEGDWSSQSNWTIASGSVRDCITFHSSLSFSDHHATQSTPTPLLLHPPSPHHSPPCQIKIRCGVAVRDDVVLSSPSVPHLTDDSVKMEDDWVEVKVPDVAKHSAKTSQDLYEATAEIDDANPCISVTLRLLSLQNKGCVYVDEIYVFADPVDSADTESQESHNENTSGSSLMAMFLPTLMQLSKTKGLSNLNALRKENQHVLGNDLEATHPSDSVIKTQLKGEATITDPQEVKLNEVQGGWMGPHPLDTFSQLAKMEGNHTSVPSQTTKINNTHSFIPSKIAEKENDHSAIPFQSAKTECNINSVPMQVAISESNPGDSLGGNVERVLEQLVSRMDRIEEICLGFQEKMVLPMNSIEARLQRVEQQLDTLTKKSQNSTLPSCSRIFAPDASCSDSDAISCDNCPDYAATKESESDEKHLHTEVRYVSAHISDSANTTQLLPGLVVTAPEFPDGEDEEVDASGLETDVDEKVDASGLEADKDEEVDASGLEADKDEEVDASGLEADEDEEVDASGPETDSSKNKAKQSIDDALSSALANFLSSTPLNSPKYTKSLTVKAPEFLNEDADDHESNSQIVKNDSVHLTDREEFGHIQVLASSNTSLENSEKINPDSNDKNSENTSQEAEEHDQFCSAEGDQDEATLKTTEHSPKADVVDNFEEDKNGKINGKKSDGLSSNTSDISNGLLDNLTPCGYNSINEEEPLSGTELTVASEVSRKTHENIIENVLGFSLASSIVDFENPILDVKFISQRTPATESFLEDFLVETQEAKESNGDFPVLKSNGDLSVEEQSNLISIEDGELVNPTSDSHFAVDKDLCTSIAAEPVNIEGDNLPVLEDHKRKRDQMSSSLI
ncbi:uncharacterized protein LOC109798690 isoform X2 [Cajanus cajan]|uniref:uncharacterized protein LOC109798690 isoform X2 n=1 Tax=Cajanus cajan TaxID=3821 RepID=UPI00098DC36F|nr:uncharacterized protein LOC109798690 isoform X2 [Cajanus cajan]